MFNFLAGTLLSSSIYALLYFWNRERYKRIVQSIEIGIKALERQQNFGIADRDYKKNQILMIKDNVVLPYDEEVL